MKEFTFEVACTGDQPPDNPAGRVLGVCFGDEAGLRLGINKRGATEFATMLPETVGRYACRFVNGYDGLVARQSVTPFNCMTFAAEAVFGRLLPGVRQKIFESRDPSYGRLQMRDVPLADQHSLQPGAMYGIASNLAIENYQLWHAFVGLGEPDRHFGVTHRGGKLVVDSTAQVLEIHARHFGPVRLVHFPEPPQ